MNLNDTESLAIILNIELLRVNFKFIKCVNELFYIFKI